MSQYVPCVGCETLCNTVVVYNDRSTDVCCWDCYGGDYPFTKGSYLLYLHTNSRRLYVVYTFCFLIGIIMMLTVILNKKS